MMHLALAFRAFFAVLFRKGAAERVREALSSRVSPSVSASVPEPPRRDERPAVPPPPSAARNDALTLLMVLQRDSRFLDLLCESLDGYSDAQIGGAARPVLQEAGKSLERLFGLQPLTDQKEGERIAIPDNASPIRWRLTGNTSAKTGSIAHHGWLATRVELPKWTGQREDAMVLAPIEVDAGS